MNPARFELMLIGWVESPLTDPETAPKQGFEGMPEATAGREGPEAHNVSRV